MQISMAGNSKVPAGLIQVANGRIVVSKREKIAGVHSGSNLRFEPDILQTDPDAGVDDVVPASTGYDFIA